MNIRKLSVFLLALILIFCFAGCGAESKAYGNSGSAMAPEAEYDIDLSVSNRAELPDKAETTTESSQSNLPENRKLIQTVRMNVEVQQLNDDTLKNLDNAISQYGGYVESSNIHNGSSYRGNYSRYADMTIRIPADRLEEFLNQVSSISNVVSSSKTVEDVTLNYVATESRLNALKTEEARLLELLSKAETMDDLLTIESRLTDVRTELERVASTLKVYDNQVDYATIYLDINEVKEYTVTEEPDGFGERVGAGLSNSLKNLWNGIVELFILLLINLPYLLLIAAVVIVIIVIIRKQDKKDKKNKNDPKKSDNETPDP